MTNTSWSIPISADACASQEVGLGRLAYLAIRCRVNPTSVDERPPVLQQPGRQPFEARRLRRLAPQGDGDRAAHLNALAYPAHRDPNRARPRSAAPRGP